MAYGNTFIYNSSLEDYQSRMRAVHTAFTFTASGTAASRVITSDNPGLLLFNYIGTGSQPTITQDAQATFGTLSAGASGSATVGLLVECKDADSAFPPSVALLGNTTGTGAATAITYTLVGTSTTGVTTTLKNIALVVSFTSFDSTTTNVTTGELVVTYRRLVGK